jgi:hypothetical protein
VKADKADMHMSRAGPSLHDAGRHNIDFESEDSQADYDLY